MEEYIFNISGEEIQERLDAVPNKADKDSVYTKTETDAKFSQLEQEQIQGGVYDVSAHNNGAIFESLQALLNSPNLSTLIPISVQHGGMSIRFINSDNKYVQYRYMGTAVTGTPNPFLNTANWQGVDDEPTAGSHNLVKSGGVYNIVGIYDESFSFNSKEGWASKRKPFVFISGHTYEIVVKTDENVTTYFKTTDSSYNTLQNHIAQGKGARASQFTCNATSYYVYMYVQDATDHAITFDVRFIDMTELNLAGIDFRLGFTEEYISKYTKGIKSCDFDFMTGSVAQYANRYVSFNFQNGHVYAVNVLSSDNIGTYFSTRDNNGNIKQNYLCGGRDARLNKFTCTADATRFYVTLKEEMSTRIVYRVFLVDLTELSFESLDLRIQMLDTSLSNQTESNTNHVSNEENVLGIDFHEKEGRSFTFSKTGHYIRRDGTLGDSENWTMSNVVRLYKGETVSIFCSTTSGGVIVALTDTTQSFYSPVVSVNDNQVQALHKYTATEDCYVILQYFKKTGSPSIVSDSARILGIEAYTKSLDNRIVLLEDNTPFFVLEERKRLLRKLSDYTNANSVIIVFNTDQHFAYPYKAAYTTAYDPAHVMNGVNSILAIAKEIPIDIVVFGGDVAGYEGEVSSTVKGILGELMYLISPFGESNLQIVSMPGNHDAYQNNSNIKAEGMYNTCFKAGTRVKSPHHNGYDNCDLYYDDSDKKIRYIFVDAMTRNGRVESFSDFLSSALSTMPNDHQAVIFSHGALTNEFAGILYKYPGDSDENGTSAFEVTSDQHQLLNQYADRIIACICGHAHTDAWGINSSGILFIETTTAAPHTRRRFGNIPYKRAYDNINETAFDFFIIDTATQTIEAVRYGQGTNRKWKYKGTGQGLISYKNCVSGAVSIPSLTLTFTNSSDNTDVVNVTCDAHGFYEVYLTLGTTYTITCNGYTLDVNSVEVSENKVVNITATSE